MFSSHRSLLLSFWIYHTKCWLAERLSPFKFYQFLLGSVPDGDVIRFLKMLTFLPLGDIAALESAMSQPGYAPNTAQRLLAEEGTRFVHGQPGLQQALSATQVSNGDHKLNFVSFLTRQPSATFLQLHLCASLLPGCACTATDCQDPAAHLAKSQGTLLRGWHPASDQQGLALT